METSELIKKVRKIEIKTRGLTNEIFSGSYHSAFKGRGMAFSEVREYIAGDDIRDIDWNVTARLSAPFIKVFEEERELTVILMVDVSQSQSFGTSTQFKRDLITELCAILAFSAIANNDKIGLLLFSDKIEKFIPPKKGKFHILRIIRELLEFKPESKGTDVSQALSYLANVLKKRAIVFMFSDFISSDFDKPLRIISRKHDTIAMQIYDTREKELGNFGMLHLKDSESDKILMIDSSSSKVRQAYSDWWNTLQKTLNSTFTRSKVDVIKIRTDESYIPPLKNFFKKRGKKR